jgi:hypothetical protein
MAIIKAQTGLDLTTDDDLQLMSREVYASTLHAACRAGRSDGLLGRSASVLNDSGMADDVIRAYLTGWNETGKKPSGR